MKKYYLFGFLLMLLIISCDDENMLTIIEMEDYYEFPVGRNSKIAIKGGSGDYQITVADTSVLHVSCEKADQLIVNPTSKGETNFTIYDNKTGAVAGATIKIVDSYYCFAIGNPARVPFLSGEYLFLLQNESKDLYLFDKDLNLLDKGNHLWGKSERCFTLAIQFDKEHYGYKNLDLEITSGALWLADMFFSNQSPQSRTGSTREIAPTVINAINDETGIEYYFALKDKTFPYSILK